MSSPSKKSSPTIDSKSHKAIKIEMNEDSDHAESNGVPARRSFCGVSDESPVQSQSSSEASGTVAVGRSGRVRKAKVVFDPSDTALVAKRKSWSAAEIEVKPKKMPRTSDAKKEASATQPLPVVTKKIEQRRKTVGATVTVAPPPPTDDGNGCIVCTRSDIKKGRFVVCVNCSTRGHFTCLRNGKFLTSALEEKHWQCDTCLRCANCNETKKEGNLFKCTLCFLSFHLNCLLERVGQVTKKKFKCDDCLGVEHDDDDDYDDDLNEEVIVKTIEPLPNKTPGNGFAGFSQEETTKSSASGRSSSSGCSSDVRADNSLTQQLQFAHHLKPNLTKLEPLRRSTTTGKSSCTYGASNNLICTDTSDIKSDLINLVKTEPEDRMPTPDPEQNAHSYRLTQNNVKSMIAPRKSIANYDTDEDTIEMAKSDDIKYDRSTRVRPHESIPDVKKWDCDEVYTYFLGTTTAEYAHLFRENQIDGDALLLIKREDVLNRFNLKLGPALRLYSHIVTLQYKNNNPILAWDED